MKKVCFILLISTIILSCMKNRGPVSWDANYSTPLAYGSLGITDIISDTLYSINTDNTINIHYKRNLYQLSLDSIVELPDNQLSNVFALPFPVAIDFNPGQTFINQPEEQNFSINSVELKDFSIESAILNYTITSTIQGEVIYDYTVNSAIDINGNPFQISIVVPAAQNGSSSQISGTINIPASNWNLEGASGNEINTILTTVNVKVSENNLLPISVSNLDTLYIDNEIKAIVPISARGYFGEEIFQTGLDTTKLDFLNSIVSGSIGLSNIEMNLISNNGIGTDFRMLINSLSSIGNNYIDLNHSIIGQTQNINRAYKVGNSIITSESNQLINSSNSNINAFLENLPSDLGYDIMVELNPLGNVSGHNDFIHKDFPLNLDLDLTTPLAFNSNQLTIIDTIDIDLPDTIGINYGSLYLELTNGFPLEAEILISTLNSPSQFQDLSLISGANLNSSNIVSTPAVSSHVINVSAESMEELKTSRKIIISATFNTLSQPQLVDFYDYYNLSFKISADFNTTVTVQ